MLQEREAEMQPLSPAWRFLLTLRGSEFQVEGGVVGPMAALLWSACAFQSGSGHCCWALGDRAQRVGGDT